MMSWRFRRQLVAIVFATMAVSLFAGSAIYFLAYAPSCTDGKMNGNEERTDCGGDCLPCLDVTVRDPVVLWTRFFALGDGKFDVAAYIRNENLRSAGTLNYTLGLEDASGKVVAEQSGSVYLRPNERTVLFAPSLSASAPPVRATLKTSLASWQFGEPEQLGVTSAGYDIRFDPSPTLTLKIRNQMYVESEKLEISALLLDASGNVYALSRTVRNPIAGGATDEAVFTWPSGSFETSPVRVESVITRAR